MKKLFSILLVILMLIGMLVSCNVDNTDTNTNTNTNTSTDTSTQTDTSTNTEETTPSIPQTLQITDLPELDGIRHTKLTGVHVYYNTKFETLEFREGAEEGWPFIDALYNSCYELVDDESSVNESKYSFEIVQYKDETFEMDIFENETRFEISEYMEYESNTYVLKGEIVEWLDALVERELYTISASDALQIAMTHFFGNFTSRLNEEYIYSACLRDQYDFELDENNNLILEAGSLKYWRVVVYRRGTETRAEYTIEKSNGNIKNVELYGDLKPNN